ncbi:MAG: branched-chain amino acid ABC transporter permease [Anaerolineales bacterium]|nr:branched-chain amino acid ABC transporter permease [Anaerolineales bacterium]
MGAIVESLAGSRAWLAERRKWLLALLGLVALVYPFIVRSYFLSLAIEVLIFAIFAMSLDLLLGYTGLPSFGHAAFYGFGAYLLAYTTSRSELALNLTNNLLLTIPLVMLGTALLALVIGFFALRTSGIYFLMVTLAFAQMLFSIAIGWSEVSGGSDGLPGVPRPALGLGPLSYTFDTRESYYYLVLAFFLLAWWVLRRIVSSPFGWALRGIRENEQRMAALGYRTFDFKMAAFVIAGAFAGLAGALIVHFFGIASPDNLYWTTSGEVIISLIIGGTGTLTGPIFGAAIERLLPNFASTYLDRWQTVMGVVFILFVMFAPQGVAGLLRARRAVERVE